ncbi:hypothetical protein BD410DRAFT_789337 [Rickenella mellea]|uniref:Uncharacterized protein n=1 Tax=Rickenella mellea TaxID=50990 RepID=A0A4Y7Q386_9AGAM|nr:hypothetical protein BD410DRAFT_789337 [Rickenella mellea]
MATATTSMTGIRSSPNGMADNLHLPGSSVSVNKRDRSPSRFGGIGRRLKSLIPTRSPTHVEPYTYNQHAKSVDGFSSYYDDEGEDDMTLQDHLTYADHSSDSEHDADERDRDATLLGHGYDQQRPGRQRSTAQHRLRTRRPTTNPPARVSVTYNIKRDSIIVPRRHREGPYHAQRQQSQLPSPPLTPPKSPQSDEDIPSLTAHLQKAGRALRAIADMPWVAARVTDDIIPTPRTAPASWYARRSQPPPARVPSPVSHLDLPPIGVARSRMGTGTGSGTPSGMETPTSARMYFDGDSVRSPGSGGAEGREPPWHRDYAYYAAQPVYAYPSSPQDRRGGTQREASQHHRRYHSTPHLLSELQDQPSDAVRSPPQPQCQSQRQTQSHPPYRPTYNPQPQSQSQQTRAYAPPLSSTQSQSHSQSQNRSGQGQGHSRTMTEAHANYRRDFERELFAHDPPPFRAPLSATSAAPPVSYSAAPFTSSARSPTAYRTPTTPAPRGLGSRSGSGYRQGQGQAVYMVPAFVGPAPPSRTLPVQSPGGGVPVGTASRGGVGSLNSPDVGRRAWSG